MKVSKIGSTGKKKSASVKKSKSAASKKTTDCTSVSGVTSAAAAPDSASGQSSAPVGTGTKPSDPATSIDAQPQAPDTASDKGSSTVAIHAATTAPSQVPTTTPSQAPSTVSSGVQQQPNYPAKPPSPMDTTPSAMAAMLDKFGLPHPSWKTSQSLIAEKAQKMVAVPAPAAAQGVIVSGVVGSTPSQNVPVPSPSVDVAVDSAFQQAKAELLHLMNPGKERKTRRKPSSSWPYALKKAGKSPKPVQSAS